jgi:hypothetical protein
MGKLAAETRHKTKVTVLSEHILLISESVEEIAFILARELGV